MKNIKEIQTELKGVRQRIKEKADKIKQEKLRKTA
tara:strand:- start:352 stop:456 length:105 start_codon:yes stop_codon:yes gene_type:complete